jgi:hypothetical protein
MRPAACAAFPGNNERCILGIVIEEEHPALSPDGKKSGEYAPATFTIPYESLHPGIIYIQMYKVFRYV